MGTLYKLDFANGKSYIGITTKSSKSRFSGQIAPGINPEVAAKISMSLRGRPSSRKGIEGAKHTEEAKAKMSAAKFGKPGRKHTEESRKKISESKAGRQFSAESRQRMSDAKKGRKASEETRRRMSESHKWRLLNV